MSDRYNNLDDLRGFRKWLDAQPKEVNAALAARAALRLLPTLAELQYGDRIIPYNKYLTMFLCLARTSQLSWIIAKYDHKLPLFKKRAENADFDLYTISQIISEQLKSSQILSNHAVSAATSSINIIELDDQQEVAQYTYKAILDQIDVTFLLGGPELGISGRGQAGRARTGKTKASGTRAHIDDANYLEDAKTPKDRIELARKLLSEKLWLANEPNWVQRDWHTVEHTLPNEDHWDVWTRWYRDRLFGQPENEELEFFKVYQEQPFWNQSPAVINKAIWDKEQEILARRGTASELPTSPPEIPAQLPGVHVEIDSESGKIVFTPPASLDADGNNIAKLQSFQPQIKRLVEEALGNISANEQPELRGSLARYFELIDKPVAEINFDLVYAEGLYLEEAALAADRKVAQGLREHLSDAGLAALNSLNRLHPLFILSTKAGRENLELAREYETTKEAGASEREGEFELAEALKHAPELISPEVAATFDRIVREEDSSQHPERTSSTRLAFTYNLLTCVVAGAAPAIAATAVAYYAIGNPGAVGSLTVFTGGLQNLINKSVENTKAFKDIREPLTNKIQELRDTDYKQVAVDLQAKAVVGLKNLAHDMPEKYMCFMLENEATLRKWAGTRKSSAWVHKHLDWLTSVFKSGPKN